MYRIFVMFAVFLSVLPAYGQELPKPKKQPDDKFLTFAFENDSIGQGSDRNYTNGVRLTYFDTTAHLPKTPKNMADALPFFSVSKTSQVFYSLGQNIYTPRDITQSVQDLNDRPWAAFLYGSIGMLTASNDQLDELEMTLGVVGPAALGKQVQTAVHKHLTDSPEPRGWANQLKNEPGLIVSWQRRWPEYFYKSIGAFKTTLEPHVGLSFGNVYTYASTGISFRFGRDDAPWSDTPLRVRPALPGTGAFDISDDRIWDWHIFGGIEARAVARNIFLDGNTFTDSHSVNKFPLVGDANVGVAFTLGSARLSYTLVYRTKEFVEQEKPDLFGAISFAYKF